MNLPSHQIPLVHGFRIPKGYYREFILQVDSLEMRIVARGEDNSLRYQPPPFLFEDQTTALNWVEECVARVMMDCKMKEEKTK